MAVWLARGRQKKGGDIDLLVRPAPAEADQPFVKKIRMLTLLERLQVATQAAGQLLKVVERFNQKLLEI